MVQGPEEGRMKTGAQPLSQGLQARKTRRTTGLMNELKECCAINTESNTYTNVIGSLGF